MCSVSLIAGESLKPLLMSRLHLLIWYVPVSLALSPFPVIKEFGKQIGVDIKQVQGLVRLAKKNGEKLGFLA